MSNKDVYFTSCRASGSGGQNVNKVSSAVRLKHKETGETVFCQEERKQGSNRKKALKRLERKLNKQKKKKHKSEEDEKRRDQVGSGMRGDKIRTYNYKHNRVTNNENGKVVNSIKKIVEQGRIDLIQ